MFYPKFNIIDELLTDFWCKIVTQGYLGWVLTSQGSIPLATRCNAYSYPVFVGATRPMSCPKCSFIDEFLTNFWCKIGTQGYLGWVVPSRGRKLLPPRCIGHRYPVFVSATHPIPCPKFGIIDEFLTNFWIKIGILGDLGWVVLSQGSMPLSSRCNALSYPVFVSATHPMSCPKFGIVDEILTDFWCKIGV